MTPDQPHLPGPTRVALAEAALTATHHATNWLTVAKALTDVADVADGADVQTAIFHAETALLMCEDTPDVTPILNDLREAS